MNHCLPQYMVTLDISKTSPLKWIPKNSTSSTFTYLSERIQPGCLMESITFRNLTLVMNNKEIIVNVIINSSSSTACTIGALHKWTAVKKVATEYDINKLL